MTVTANTSQRSRVGVGMNRSVREGMGIYDYFTLDDYYDKHHNNCLQADSQITEKINNHMVRDESINIIIDFTLFKLTATI